MALLKQQQLVENDPWQIIGAEDDLPAGDIIVPLARWQTEHDTLLKHTGRVGIALQGDSDLTTIIDDLQHFPVIAVAFPIFRDGRCLSHARLLRERYHYEGEIRAIGDVQRDQLNYMARCGIDAFQLREDQDPQLALRAFEEFSVRYQTAADKNQPLYRQRQG